MNNRPFHTMDDVTLSPEERELIRGRIVSYMQEHPLPTASVWSDLAGFVWGNRFLVACASIVIVIAGLSYVVDRARPGEYFYTAKTTIEESLADAFMASPESEMEWDINTAEQRMQEIEQLAADLGW